jgi:hypothetical protein
VKALKVARAFHYDPEEALMMPIAKILFLHSGLQVIEGVALPEKHLSPEDKSLAQTAVDRKDELVSVLNDIRGMKQ